MSFLFDANLDRRHRSYSERTLPLKIFNRTCLQGIYEKVTMKVDFMSNCRSEKEAGTEKFTSD